MEQCRDRGGDYIEGDNISIVWFFFNKGLEHESGFFIATPCILSTRHTLEKNWEYSEAVHQLCIDFKTTYDSVRREVLYNILIELWISMKLIRLIKMCLNENYSRFRVGKHLSDVFPIRNGLKQGDALSSLLFNFALDYAIRGFR